MKNPKTLKYSIGSVQIYRLLKELTAFTSVWIKSNKAVSATPPKKQTIIGNAGGEGKNTPVKSLRAHGRRLTPFTCFGREYIYIEFC